LADSPRQSTKACGEIEMSMEINQSRPIQAVKEKSVYDVKVAGEVVVHTNNSGLC
jgi:hypothetical protein